MLVFSFSILHYGTELPSKRGRIYILYTGQHYDPLLGQDGTLVFPSAGEALEASALKIAKARASTHGCLLPACSTLLAADMASPSSGAQRGGCEARQ